MSIFLNTSEVVRRSGRYVDDFRRLYGFHGLSCGAPEDLPRMAARLSSNKGFRLDFSALVRSVRDLEGGRMAEAEMLTVAAMASGGDGIGAAERDLRDAANVISLLLDGMGGWSDADEAVDPEEEEEEEEKPQAELQSAASPAVVPPLPVPVATGNMPPVDRSSAVGKFSRVSEAVVLGEEPGPEFTSAPEASPISASPEAGTISGRPVPPPAPAVFKAERPVTPLANKSEPPAERAEEFTPSAEPVPLPEPVPSPEPIRAAEPIPSPEPISAKPISAKPISAKPASAPEAVAAPAPGPETPNLPLAAPVQAETPASPDMRETLARLELASQQLKIYLDDIDRRMGRIEPHLQDITSMVHSSAEYLHTLRKEAAPEGSPAASQPSPTAHPEAPVAASVPSSAADVAPLGAAASPPPPPAPAVTAPSGEPGLRPAAGPEPSPFASSIEAQTTPPLAAPAAPKPVPPPAEPPREPVAVTPAPPITVGSNESDRKAVTRDPRPSAPGKISAAAPPPIASDVPPPDKPAPAMKPAATSAEVALPEVRNSVTASPAIHPTPKSAEAPVSPFAGKPLGRPERVSAAAKPASIETSSADQPEKQAARESDGLSSASKSISPAEKRDPRISPAPEKISVVPRPSAPSQRQPPNAPAGGPAASPLATQAAGDPARAGGTPGRVAPIEIPAAAARIDASPAASWSAPPAATPAARTDSGKGLRMGTASAAALVEQVARPGSAFPERTTGEDAAVAAVPERAPVLVKGGAGREDRIAKSDRAQFPTETAEDTWRKGSPDEKGNGLATSKADSPAHLTPDPATVPEPASRFRLPHAMTWVAGILTVVLGGGGTLLYFYYPWQGSTARPGVRDSQSGAQDSSGMGTGAFPSDVPTSSPVTVESSTAPASSGRKDTSATRSPLGGAKPSPTKGTSGPPPGGGNAGGGTPLRTSGAGGDFADSSAAPRGRVEGERAVETLPPPREEVLRPAEPSRSPETSSRPADTGASMAGAASGDVPTRPTAPASSGVAPGNSVNLVSGRPPIYPKDAQRMGVQGKVVLQAVVGPNGSIKSVQVVDGPVVLRQSAIDAVRQWKYRPHVVNGQAAEFQTRIVVDYHMK